MSMGDLAEAFSTDPEYACAWSQAVGVDLCFRIKRLREAKGWSQAHLAGLMGVDPARISRLENPNANEKPTLSTLLRLADAFGMGLDVRFVSYEEMACTKRT